MMDILNVCFIHLSFVGVCFADVDYMNCDIAQLIIDQNEKNIYDILPKILMATILLIALISDIVLIMFIMDFMCAIFGNFIVVVLLNDSGQLVFRVKTLTPWCGDPLFNPK